jgi:hypothetical protein
VSKHLKVLEAAELIAQERRGSFQIVRLNAKSRAYRAARRSDKPIGRDHRPEITRRSGF